MLRGGVFIGVDKTTGGGLPVLNAAAAGAKEMYDWATAPSPPRARVSYAAAAASRQRRR